MRSVGVALRDTNGEFRNTDDVFMELASKWDTLTSSQKKYISTTAAGSRQQSRFQAMLSDYARTQELVTAAYGSNGAANEQYEKTLDSLKSKLTQLSNAWATFTMRLMDNKVIKLAVTLLTQILQTINKIIDAFGAFGSALQIGLLVSSLTVADKVLSAFFTTLKSTGSILQGLGAALSKLVGPFKTIATFFSDIFSEKGRENATIFRTAREGFQSIVIDAENAKKAVEEYNEAQKKVASFGEAPAEKVEEEKSSKEDSSKTQAQAQKTSKSNRNTSKQKIKQRKKKEEEAKRRNNQAKDSKDPKEEKSDKNSKEGKENLEDSQEITEKKAEAEQKLKEALEGVNNAYALNKDQQEKLMGLREAGIEIDKAAELAKAGLTKENIEQIATSKGVTKQEAAEILLKQKNITSTSGLTIAEMLHNVTKKKQEGDQRGYIALLWEEIAAKNAATIATLKNLAATALASPIFWGIVAAIAALVAIIVPVVFALTYLGRRMEAAAEGAEQATQTANDLNEGYKELRDSIDDLTESYDSLNDLTQGTQEWMDAVKDLNQEVFDLIDKYPELAKFAKMSEDGILTIDTGDKDVRDIISQAEQSANKAQAAATYAQAYSSKTIQEYIRHQGKYDTEQDRQKALDEEKSKEEAYKQSYALQILNMVGSAQYSEQAQKIISAMSSAGMEKYAFDQALLSASDGDLKNYADNVLGYKSAKVGKDKITYTDENGEEKSVDKESFKQQYAAAEAAEKMADSLTKIPGVVNKMAKGVGGKKGSAIQALYSKSNGMGLRQGDFEALGTDADSIEQNAREAWNKLEVAEREIFPSFDAFLDSFASSVGSAETALAEAAKIVQESGLNEEFYKTMDLSAGTAKQYAAWMQSLKVRGKDISGVEEELSKVMNLLSPEDKDSFLFQLTSLDIADLSALEKFPSIIESLKIDVPNDEMEELIDKLKEVGDASKKVDFKSLVENVTTLSKLYTTIRSGEQGRAFSEETYKEVVELLPEAIKNEFKQDLDGNYIYLGESMEKLREAVEANTQALGGGTVKSLSNKVSLGYLMDNISFNGMNMSNLNADTLSDKGLRDVLAAFAEEAKGLGLTIEGIGNYSENTQREDLNLLGRSDLLDIFNKINTDYYQNLSSNETSLNSTVLEALLKAYQANTGAQNTTGTIQIANNRDYQELDRQEKDNFDARTDAFTITAINAGVDSETLGSWRELVDLYKEGKISLEELLEYQAQVSNDTDYRNMRAALEKTLTTVDELVEEYEQLAGGDTKGKNSLVRSALANFGIAFDENDKEQGADFYMDLLSRASMGDSSAISDLISKAASQSGIKGWRPMEDELEGELSESQIDFLTRMQELGFGMWEINTEGIRQFTWASAEAFNSAAEAAGTAQKLWENPYDWLYNYNEKLNQKIREREQSERRYNRALQDETKTAEGLIALSEAEIDALKAEAQIRAKGADLARDEIEALAAENSQYSEYYSYDKATNSLFVDYNKLNETEHTDEWGKDFEEFIGKMTDYRDTITSVDEELDDIYNEIQEIGDRGKDEASSLYDSIKDGLIKSYQNEIDALSDINDSINDAQSAIVDRIQEQIDDARQARENEKAERELTDKQTRLSYLRRDTSGANALEIAQLQKELEEGQESYSDSLVDQSIQKLQDANEKAAEQRERQIELQQAQLDAYSEGQQVWKDVEEIISVSFKEVEASGKAWADTIAGSYSKLADQVSSLNPIEQVEWKASYDKDGKLASIYMGYATSKATGGTLSNTANGAKADIEDLEDKLPSSGTVGGANVPTSDTNFGQEGGQGSGGGKTEDSVVIPTDKEDAGFYGRPAMNGQNITPIDKELDEHSSYRYAYYASTAQMDPGARNSSGGITNAKYGIFVPGLDKRIYWNFTTIPATEKELNEIKQLNCPSKNLVVLDGSGYIQTYDSASNQFVWQKIQQSKPNNSKQVGGATNVAEWLKSLAINTKYGIGAMRYKTGGLADFTGPAWLDGTKSNPELVLNATDTANFILLKDILSDILNGSSASGGSANGDNYFDININVEKLEDDYDVDQLADKIKNIIYEDSTYRNVNAINNIR